VLTELRAERTISCSGLQFQFVTRT